MTKRKFYRQVFEVEVLSDEPIQFLDLAEIADAITGGGCSGVVETLVYEEIDGAMAAKLLQKQENDPMFFRLTSEGEDATG